MPELPEVETMRLGMARHIKGKQIERVRVKRRDLRFGVPRGFASALTGARVAGLLRRGKYILVRLDGGGADYWLAHLGMSGRFLWRDKRRDGGALVNRVPHTHLVFEFADGVLLYSDPRRFGFVDLIWGAPKAHPRLAGLGAEPLQKSFDARLLAARVGARKAPIKQALLDQSGVAGLGNIYVCEALYGARLHPQRSAASLEAADWARLVREIKRVLKAAIAAGGSSLKDFSNADGEAGYFQHGFKVYGRAGERCGRRACGGVVKSVVLSGRSSFFCPACQEEH